MQNIKLSMEFKYYFRYGLLIPKKKQSTFKASNVFGDDSDEVSKIVVK